MNQFSNTIQLPETKFSMRAKLNQNEPKWIKFWEETSVQKKIKDQNKNKKRFILHDGPPYANGNLHLGHALNKILKDIISRSHSKMGFNVDYVPGWDCHGLPIEWKVEENYRKSGKNKDEVDQLKFRDECRKFAEKWIEIQTEEFKRLGINCDWTKKYTTMTNEAEAIIVSELMKFLMGGRLYLGHKPVMWSVVENTALAEAEIEYQEKKSSSIFVKFRVKKAKENLFKDANIVIWTTTPWTLPGNRAIAFSENVDYIIVSLEKNYIDLNLKKDEKVIFSSLLFDQFCIDHKVNSYTILKKFKGNELENMICEHPFFSLGYDYDVPLIKGEHVTNETGTGFVHIAPGHGIEDFELGKKFNIEVPNTVNSKGIYFENVPFFSGIHIYKADKLIIEKLAELQKLIYYQEFNHSYPHSWRSKAPLIYRTTSQWFISMEEKELRSSAVSEIEKVNWIPESSKNRITSMVSERPDWCVSRQRSWGVPITIFLDKKNNMPLLDKEVNEKIINLIKEHGTDIWFSEDNKVFLTSDYNPDNYIKVTDILDVWFDSGASHAFVLKNREITEKADLYLEGSDQHRGWFQSSLLESCAIYNESPYKSVLTHGFVLDEKGKKMSKSLGNVISPDDVIKKYGADILRLWVATSNYNEDLKISYESLNRQTEIYRKIRNTIRFLLGNLKNWNEKKEKINHEDLPELEKYIRYEIYSINEVVLKSFKSYNFYRAFQLISNFCNNELSSLFFDIRKDTLYCEPINSYKRNSARTVMVDVFKILINWLSPVLVFTTEESWQCWLDQKNIEKENSCHLIPYHDLPDVWNNENIYKNWKIIKNIRKAVSNLIEKNRDQKLLKSSLEAKANIFLGDTSYLDIIKDINLSDILIVSEAIIVEQKDESFFEFEEDKNISIKIEPFNGTKCERCWKIFKKKGSELICNRCDEVIKISK
ncbi:isoleucine--tRNA ligase [Rickettsiales bacterium]|nr:isoleucine--tRNA ligase [Rickettsiales bacterium]